MKDYGWYFGSLVVIVAMALCVKLAGLAGPIERLLKAPPAVAQPAPQPPFAPSIQPIGPRRYLVTIPEWKRPIKLEFEELHVDGKTHPHLYQLNPE